VSIHDLIDRSLVCAKCGAKSCRCWVTLRCPKCKATQTTERTPDDGSLDIVSLLCPDCMI
jgi:hypothetical protein